MILKMFLSIAILFMSLVAQADITSLLFAGDVGKGVGEWREVPFGKMRLLSCTTGAKGQTLLVGGLQVQLNPDWILKKPTINSVHSDLPLWSEAPVRSGNGQNVFYEQEVFFPMVYVHNPMEENDFDFGLKGEFPACNKEGCITFPIQMSIELSAKEAEPGSYCAYIMKKHLQVPLPAETQKIQGYAWPDGEEVHMAFLGLENVTLAFLQTVKDDFKMIESLIQSNGVMMRVKTKQWVVGEKKDWILLTNQGIFKVPVQMGTSPVSLPFDESVPWYIWFMGINLFFCTPLFIWWGTGIVKTNKLWKKELLKFWSKFPAVFILWSVITYLGGYSFLKGEFFIYYAILLFGLVCLFPPQKWYSALALFLIWPYHVKLSELSGGEFLIWNVIILLEMALPFAFLYLRMTDIGKVLRDFKKKNFFYFNLMFLLPTVIMLVMNIGLLGQTDFNYSKNISSDGVSVVCDKKACSKWTKILDVHLIPSDSLNGKILRQIYPVDAGELVIFQKNKERVVWPKGISPEKVLEFIDHWKKHHVVNRPDYPLVHFQDDQRAPSPNAK